VTEGKSDLLIKKLARTEKTRKRGKETVKEKDPRANKGGGFQLQKKRKKERKYIFGVSFLNGVLGESSSEKE